MAWYPVFPLITAILLLGGLAFKQGQKREQLRNQLRHTACQEGIGDEYDLELKEQLKLQSFRPKDDLSGPDPYREALHVVRLRKRIMAKNPPPGDNTIFNISHSTVAGLNFGTVLGDLSASVQILQTHRGQQIAGVKRSFISSGSA